MRSRRRYIALVFLLLVTMIVGACRGDSDDKQGGPTPPSFPTATTFPNQTGTASSSLPTALPSPSGPTPTRFAGFPTLSVPPTVPANYPNQIQIVSPVAAQQMAGNFTIFGSASHPDFVQYALEYGPDPNPSNLWYPITPQAVTRPVINNALGAWNTTLVPDGAYQVRLHVWLTQGRENTSVVVSQLQVRNTQAPPPPSTNRNPSISPIAPLNLQRGTTATLALGIFDPDGDPTTFIATSDNTAVVSITPSGQAITVFALSKGVATIRIRVADNRGGLAETSFLTTVVEPPQSNNPPNIAPIPNQTITQGATINIPVTISDPDGDTVSFTVASAAPSIAQVSKGANNQSINIAGFAPGSTSVTITATDGRGQSRLLAFSVAVNPPSPSNNPPSIGAIPGQTLLVGETLDISLSIFDPDAGDTTSYTPLSSNPAVVGVSDLGGNKIRITGNSEGSGSITITVRDSRNATASTVFGVTVNAPPSSNQNPSIGPIPEQTLEVGKTVTIALSISDPDNDPLTFSSSSDSPSIVTTGQVDASTLSITGVSQGSAVITVAVGDGRGGSATTQFKVGVTAPSVPNNPPVLQPINSQSVTVGQSLEVPIQFSDADNDSITVFANSDNPAVAAAIYQSGNSTVNLTGIAVGAAEIIIDISDGRGGEASQRFLVNVVNANQNPVIDAVADQSCDVGDSLSLSIQYSDPDGDAVSVTPSSSAAGVATASVVDNTLSVNCIGEGNATITLSVDDGKGGSASVQFAVTVGSANQNPALVAVSNQSCEVGASVVVNLSYSDPDGDSVSVNAVSSDNSIAAPSLAGDNVTLTVNCLAAGTATITVDLSDGQGGSASGSFQVNVSQPAPVNQNPVIDAVAGQSCVAGDTLNLSISFSDPDGNPVTVSASSDNSTVASGSVAGNSLSVNCAAEGFATITLTADDGQGGTASTSFTVSVSAPAPVNQNPVIDAVAGQSCVAGDTLSLTINFSDPDGNPVSISASSDNSVVASGSVAGNSLSVNCAAEGVATITLTADDGQGGTASTSFGVSVSAPAPVNQNPVIDAVAGQSCVAGDTLSLTINFSDPDGNPVSVSASSDNSVVASGSVAGNSLSVNCAAEGFATITLTADDGQGGTASTSFGVSVSAPAPVNQNPVIDAVADQSCQVGDTLNLTIGFSDPDGNSVSVSASSENPGIVSASVAGNSLSLNCGSEGFASVTLTADDGQGGTASTSFTVNVTGVVAPPFDINAYPEIPDLAALKPQLAGIYNNGVNNLGRNPNAFSIVGDDSLNGGNFLDLIAAGTYNLGNFGSLADTVNFFNFGFQSVGIGTGWSPSTLLNAASADPGLCNPGESPIDCELRLTAPVVVIISFAPNSVVGTPVAQFKAELETVIDRAINVGTIPVLVTLPNDGTVDVATLNQYNEAIVQAATEHSAHPDLDVPLWNLHTTMQGASAGVYSTSPSGAADYTDASLQHGVNRRGLVALRVLDAFRVTFP